MTVFAITIEMAIQHFLAENLSKAVNGQQQHKRVSLVED